jgi:hypothetical protein
MHALCVYSSTIIKRYWGRVESLFIQAAAARRIAHFTFMMHTRGWIRAHNTFKILIIRRERAMRCASSSFHFVFYIHQRETKKGRVLVRRAPFSLSSRDLPGSTAGNQTHNVRLEAAGGIKTFYFFLCASAHRSVNQKMCINACAPLRSV